ncbi:MAG: ribonuclease PH [Magnetococcales bacterium]|nr:ribonuclease PH [Magnetococcales bacterium]MBF0156133.1 ribonuclease PH [Magnetococcales bacterium]
MGFPWRRSAGFTSWSATPFSWGQNAGSSEGVPVKRLDGREPGALRPVTMERGFLPQAEGSCLIACGQTRVICTASIDEQLPRWMRDQNRGWVTAEYGLLPRSTHERTAREATRGKQGGRTLEIQRLIGRSLRAVMDLERLGKRTIVIDCDVIQADGGTRTASITGAFVALVDACRKWQEKGRLAELPITDFVAATSCGLFQGVPVLDLDYGEDSTCEADVNFVMTGSGGIIEIQGTAERGTFDRATLNTMLDLAQSGIAELVRLQRQVLATG